MIDTATADLLDLIQNDWRPFAEADRNAIAWAIREDAGHHNGHVSTNRVRRLLAALPVLEQPKPQRIGPVYRALCLAGLMVPDGWESSTDRQGRNSGKPVRTYRWVD